MTGVFDGGKIQEPASATGNITRFACCLSVRVIDEIEPGSPGSQPIHPARGGGYAGEFPSSARVPLNERVPALYGTLLVLDGHGQKRQGLTVIDKGCHGRNDIDRTAKRH